MDKVELDEKVLRYEQFLNETLKRDLSKLSDEREKLYEEIAEYFRLQTTLQKLLEVGLADGSKALKTQIDLGCNFYAHAVIKDASRIFIHIGYGFYLEFTVKEAIPFIEQKVSRLDIQAEKLGKDIAHVRAQIRIVLEGLRELQGL